MSRPEIRLHTAPIEMRAQELSASFMARHVPITSRIATELAQLLVASAPTQAPRWGRCFSLMTQAVGSSGSFAGQMALRGVMDRFLLTLAEPLLRRAAADAQLLAQDLILADANDAEAQALEIALDRLLADRGVMGDAFWLAAALDLAGNAYEVARQRARLKSGTKPYEVDAQMAALVFLHPPIFDEESRSKTLRQKAKQASAHKRSGLRPKEGGVAGIIQSRSYDDLPDALMSELILPKPLLANKLFQDGILTRHRPPRRTPKRDLLSVTLMDAPAHDQIGRFVKALWADAGIRLRLALWQRGLQNSDLVWADQGGTSALDCQIDLPGLQNFPPLRLEGKARADFLLRTGLFPDHARLPSDEGRPAHDQTLAGLLRRGLTPLSHRQKREVAYLPADYGRRLAFLCRPTTRPEAPDWSALSASLKAELARPLPSANLAALVWHEPSRRIHAFYERREPLELTLPQSHEELPQIAGQLILWIIDVTMEALDVPKA